MKQNPVELPMQQKISFIAQNLRLNGKQLSQKEVRANGEKWINDICDKYRRALLFYVRHPAIKLYMDIENDEI